jgi:hypothetical protein
MTAAGSVALNRLDKGGYGATLADVINAPHQFEAMRHPGTPTPEAQAIADQLLGGQAQDPHRDYHLGFLSNETAARFPAHVHLLSPVLTLQGAVAHSDMSIESGPTMYLPYSHQYAPGYLAWRLPEFRELFQRRYVQLPLTKGDAVFFNPALFHGAGTNVSADVQRMANLLQVSSAFGRAMETVDRAKVSRAIFPVLRARREAGVQVGVVGRLHLGLLDGGDDAVLVQRVHHGAVELELDLRVRVQPVVDHPGDLGEIGGPPALGLDEAGDGDDVGLGQLGVVQLRAQLLEQGVVHLGLELAVVVLGLLLLAAATVHR